MTRATRTNLRKYDYSYPFIDTNKFLDYLCTLKLNQYEFRTILVIFRHTLGYKSDSCYISYEDIARKARFSKREYARRAVESLITRHGLISKKNHYDKPGYSELRNRYTLNIPSHLPDPGTVKVSPIQGAVKPALSAPHTGDIVSPGKGAEVSPGKGTANKYIENYIDNNKKSSKESLRDLESFNRFWQLYPLRQKWSQLKPLKTKCSQIFSKLNPKDQNLVIEAVIAFKKSDQAKRDRRIYLPDNFLTSHWKDWIPKNNPSIPSVTNQIEEWRAGRSDPPPDWRQKTSEAIR